MTASIHGHNVLNQIKTQEQPLTREQQLQAMQVRFGEEARYHTCSLKDLEAGQLLDVFLEKGKLGVKEGRLYFVGGQCQHG